MPHYTRLLEAQNLMQMSQVFVAPETAFLLGWGEAPLVLCPGNSSNNSLPLADARGSVLSAVCTEPRPSGRREYFCPNLRDTTLVIKTNPAPANKAKPSVGT